MANSTSGRLTTGQMDFSGGVDSNRVPLIASDANPNGLKANQLAWAVNATMRGGGVTQRYGWRRLAEFPTVGLFQEAKFYQPDINYQPDSGFPYIIAQIGGRTFLARTDLNNEIQEVTRAGDPNPPDVIQNWMCQGEMFMIIQDGSSNPLVWDGYILKRISQFFSGAQQKLPASQAMDYYMGRVWLSAGREYLAGNQVNGAGGSIQYRGKDTILLNTENSYLNGGGSFVVPSVAGNIRALSHTALMDTALGEGLLFVFTRQDIYSVNVPQDRAEWIAYSRDKGPLQRVAQQKYGTVSDRSVVPVNGDLFFRSVDGVRSLTMALRYFNQWGNVAISSEETRVVDVTDLSLERFSSGILFDNRLLESIMPIETPVGVASRGLMPLDFDLISSLAERLPPSWEGLHEGLYHLRLLEADFGGRQRAFSIAWNTLTEKIELWELTASERFDDNVSGEARVTWTMETPSYTWDNPFALKQLDTIELWIDRLWGRVDFTAYYRVDQSPCWNYWHTWTECASRDSCDDLFPPDPCDYPEQTYKPQYRSTMVLPAAPYPCNQSNARPANIGYAFQIKLVIKGFCRVRGLLAHALPRDKQPYVGLTC